MTAQKKIGSGLVLLVGVAALLLVAVFAGWYIWHNNQQPAATPAPQPASTPASSNSKSYTDTAKIYSFQYPNDWKLSYTTAQGNEGTRANTDWTKQSRPVMLAAPHASADASAVPSVVAVMTKAEVMMLIGKDKGDKMHTVQQLKINGYDAYYDKLVFAGPNGAEKYTDHTYILINGDNALFMYFRESYYHNNPPSNWSNSQDLPAFQGIVYSVKFL